MVSARKFSIVPVLFFALVFLVSSFLVSPSAHAGLILQHPTYTGLSSGLVGYWSFDGKDIAGVSAYDRSGNNKNGTLTGGPTRVKGKIGQGLDFDGTDDYVSAGNVTSSLKSISFWMKPDSSTDQIIGLDAGAVVLGGILSVGSLGTANDITDDTSFTLTPSATLEAGNIGILTIAKDNEATVDGNTTECNTPTDSVGNTYTKLREYANSEAGAADDAATVCVFFTKATTNLTTSDTVTMTVTTNSVKAATFWEFTVGSGNTIQVATGGAIDASFENSANLAALSLSGLTSKEYLFVRGIAAEARDNNAPATANYTQFTLGRADTLTLNTSIVVDGEFRILTATGDTSNPASWGSNRDGANTYLAIEEVAAGGGATNYIDVSSGTIGATGFTDPKIYVDGAVTSVITAGSWHHVVIKTDTDVTADSVDLGRISGTGNFDGLIDDVRIYNRALSADEIKRLYKIGATLKVNTTINNDSLSKGLIGWWSFDGPDMLATSTGRGALDGSGQNNTGYLINGPVLIKGKIGQALSFDGSNDYINLATPTINNTGTYSISGWLKTTHQGNHVDIYNEAGTASRNIDVAVGEVANKITFVHRGSSIDKVDGTTSVNDGQWHHFVATRNSAGTLSLYVDTIFQGSDVLTGDGTISSTRVKMGAINDGLSQYFPGIIDEFRIYNRALTGDEIKRLYSLGR